MVVPVSLEKTVGTSVAETLPVGGPEPGSHDLTPSFSFMIRDLRGLSFGGGLCSGWV